MLRIFRIVTLIFIVESVIILIAINFDLISYGVDIQDSIMLIGVSIGLILALTLGLYIRSVNNRIKYFLVVISIATMVLFGLFYLLDNALKIN